MRAPLLALALFTACGPSFRRQARADWVYDECRALDSDPYVHPDTKRRCWQYFLDRYDAHQSERRIAYAEDRVRTNTRAANAPPEGLEPPGGQQVLPPGAPPPPSAPPGSEPPIASPGASAAPPARAPRETAARDRKSVV